jgi:phosphate transport system substrate-binding protein
VCAASLFAATACDDGAPPAPSASSVAEPQQGVLRLAGTGTMTALAVLLAKAWSEQHREPRLVVEPSVGSTGGVRAAFDGAIDLGMVARELNGAERDLGLLLVPVARDAVVMASHASVPVDDLSSEELAQLLWGHSTSFADGSPATVLLRDRDDTAHTALEAFFPALRAARHDAYEARRFRVLLHDDAMAEALMATPGALGPYSLGALSAGKLPLKALRLDGVEPSAGAMEQGRWKASRTLAFVVRPERLPLVRAFLRFVGGAQGAAILRANNCVPLEAATP